MSDELASLRERITALEQRLDQIVAQAAPTMGTNAAMARLGYKDRHSFWTAVSRLRLPYVRLNRRQCLFRTADIDAVMERRVIGASGPRRHYR